MTTETLPSTDLMLDIEIEPYLEEDDGKARFTHIINPPNNLHIWVPGMDAKDIVAIARVTNQVVVALCGYRWVPLRNPEKYDSCEECFRIASELMREMGE